MSMFANHRKKSHSILASFWNSEAFGQTVLPDRSLSLGRKIGGKCQNWKFQMRLYDFFQTLWSFQGPIKKLVT